jgi:hypothetical protein
MATRKDKPAAQPRSGEPATRQHPKIKAVELGNEEQGEPVESGSRATLRKLEQQEQLHSGIPIGSDPRE